MKRNIESETVNLLVSQYERARKIEDDRLRGLEKPTRISSWNPRLTQHEDVHKCMTRIMNLKFWTESWWSKKGFAVIWAGIESSKQVPEFYIEEI